MSVVSQSIWFSPILLILISNKSDGQFEQWCIADEQVSESELQMAVEWAFGRGGGNCSKIEVYLPNTLKDHASYAFNNYHQKYKHKGASCYFSGAAMTTELDPSTNRATTNSVPRSA